MTGGGDRRQRIVDVVRADQLPLDGALWTAVLEHFEAREILAPRRLARAPQRLAVRGAGKSLERRPATHGQRLPEPRVGGVPYDPTAGRDGAHQMVELPLDRTDVGIDIGVVELEVIEDRGARTVVHELGALIEEGRVVFIGFDDEERCAAEARARGKVLRHAADQEARLETCVLEYPRKDR